MTTISHDTLHLLAGLVLWIGTALLFRRSLISPLPLLGTLVVITINEAVDLWVEIWPEPAMQFGEGAKDVVTTIAIPALLCVLFRAAPGLIRPHRRTDPPAVEAVDASGQDA